MRYLDPSTDLVFKLLFREPADEPRLIAMLTAILEPSSPIVSAVVQNPEIPAEIVPAKTIVLDLAVALADGRRVNVEMESWPRPVFVARELFYWSRLHARQLAGGDAYGTLRPTITIAWLGHAGMRRRPLIDSPQVHTRFRIRETSSGLELCDHLEMHFLDLRNLANDVTLSPALRRWAEFLDSPTEATLERLAKEDDIMADTVHKLASVSQDDATFYLAEARRRAAYADWDDRRYEREEGRAEGRAEGEEGALRAAVVGVLTARFGSVSGDLRARIDALPVVELHRMLARAATAESVDEV